MKKKFLSVILLAVVCLGGIVLPTSNSVEHLTHPYSIIEDSYINN